MTVNNIDILPMSETTVGAVSEMEQKQFSTPWSYDSLKKTLQSDSVFYYVALLENRVVGYIGVSISYDSADITTFCVSSACRRNGIGTRLLDHVIAQCMEKMIKNIFLEVRESNQTARKFYEKSGFVFLSRRRNYYKQPTEDALVLQKEISK